MPTADDVAPSSEAGGGRVPVRKVQAGAATGALTVVLLWILGLVGLDAPAEVGAALSTLLAFAVSYMVPERS